MKKIDRCPSLLAEGHTTYSPLAIRRLFNGMKANPILDFIIEDFQSAIDINDALHRISVSGVQEKFPAIIEDGAIRISDPGVRSTHILKPAPWDMTLQNRKQIPANEHLTMQIASQVYGIATAENGLCFTPKGQPVYITRRFDILPDGEKLQMEDFASVIGRKERGGDLQFKYNGTYEEIASAIRETVPAWMVDMERFFNLVVYNYIYANGDAHLKNFSLINSDGNYRLAPAYDLINTSLHVNGDDFGLDGGLSTNIEMSDTYERTGHPCRADFEQFGIRIGLPPKRIARVLDQYMHIPEKAVALISRSYLDPKLRRQYRSIVSERVARFIRPGD